MTDPYASDPLKAAAVAFLQLVAGGAVETAYASHVGPGFQHHNPYFREDAASLRAGMAADAAAHPNKVLVIHRVVREGDVVVVHSHVRQAPEDRGAALVHFFRFEEGRIVEAWDVGQSVPADPVNAAGMF